jgi:ribosomal-protein-alanine N-acetyltransferase
VHVQVLDAAAVTADGVRALAAALADQGVHHVVTNAMSTVEAVPFLDAGFRVRSELDLLARPLQPVPPRGAGTRRARTRRTRDLAAVLALDHLAFDADSFDGAALDAARHATPAVRLRVVGAPGAGARGPLGYAITGVAGRRGYVQRLAVHPDARRQGIGATLLVDGLRWARRRGAREAVVNTDRGNAAARSLYEAHGFVELPTGLVVLERGQ